MEEKGIGRRFKSGTSSKNKSPPPISTINPAAASTVASTTEAPTAPSPSPSPIYEASPIPTSKPPVSASSSKPTMKSTAAASQQPHW